MANMKWVNLDKAFGLIQINKNVAVVTITILTTNKRLYQVLAVWPWAVLHNFPMFQVSRLWNGMTIIPKEKDETRR